VTPGARPSGVIDKLDYIEGLGFDCIWITPVVKSLDYTGYFAEDTECEMISIHVIQNVECQS